VNLIKVDKAPAGEHLILPESSEIPVMNHAAHTNLEKLMQKSIADKPVIRPAVRSTPPPQMSSTMTVSSPSAIVPTSAPSPEVPTVMEAVAPTSVQELSIPLPPPLPSLPTEKQSGRRPFHQLVPVFIGISGALALGSGIYLVVQGKVLWDRARATASVQRSVEPATKAVALTQAPAVVAPVVTDQLHQNAMAPLRQDPPVAETAKLVVRAKSNYCKLHTGPGLNFPVSGIADPSVHYNVVEWNERWFRIVPKTGSEQSGRTVARSDWIRNDLVQLITESAATP